MIRKVFALFDRRAATFSAPMCVPSKGVLLRELTHVLARPAGAELDFVRYPKDFQLFELGEFDDVKGRFTLLDFPDLCVEIGDLMPEGHAAPSGAGAGVDLDSLAGDIN